MNFKIQDLEHKNSLLTENIDLDFIEILIRDKFLFGKEGETTYIIKQMDKIKPRHPEKVKNPINPIKKKPEWIRSKLIR